MQVCVEEKAAGSRWDMYNTYPDLCDTTRVQYARTHTCDIVQSCDTIQVDFASYSHTYI